MNSLLFYLSWVPIAILFYMGYAWITKQNNELGGNWLYILYIYGAFGQIWPLVSRYSKNLLIDGFIFDTIIIAAYVSTLIYLGAGESFNKIQWCGAGLALIGILMMKLEGV